MIRILFDFPFPQNIILFALLAFALLFSLVMHELGHGYVALWNGDSTAKYNNRLSLNPAKHLDPIGFLMLIVAGFGYAKPVPINSRNFKNYRRGLFTVSIAGISVNIILAFISCGILAAVGRFVTNNTAALYLGTFFYYLMLFNLTLCFFNLLPLFPLDGFHVIESFTKYNNRFVQFMRRNSMYILVILIALNVIVDRADLNFWWWQYVDVLGQYLFRLSNLLIRGFSWFWGLIF